MSLATDIRENTPPEMKGLLKETPLMHIEYMGFIYEKNILSSARKAMIYTPKTYVKNSNIPIDNNVSIKPNYTTDALFEESYGSKTAILNFANFTTPGGGYLYGARAQEEALCGDSDLYNVLALFTNTYYKDNIQMGTNKGLYHSRVLYLPNIVFVKDGVQTMCDVITCAAPNWNEARRNGVTKEENTAALRERIETILKSAADQKVKTLLLGAYGCGVFGQDPYEVSSIFKEESKNYSFEKIVYAVPDMNSTNFQAFYSEFGGKETIRKASPIPGKENDFELEGQMSLDDLVI